MTKYRLGLDVGTNSLGWSVLELDKKGDPCAIINAGSRIFSDGRDKKTKATLAADRRDARSARRRRDRFKQRQTFLLAELENAGLLPPESEAREALRDLNPLKLRAKALTEKLEPYEIGRALFHLNQRRGFQSNRKDRSDEVTDGTVTKSERILLEDMGLIDRLQPNEGQENLSKDTHRNLSKEDKKRIREEKKHACQEEAKARNQALEKLKDQKQLTYGWFLYEKRHRHKEPTRVRRNAGDDGKLYDVYPTRALYKDEFNKIWDAQAKHHPELMTDEKKDRIHYVIFTQRPLKPQKRGQCTYMPEKTRTFRAMPSFQNYRIYQEVNNLEWATSEGKECLRNNEAARKAIIEMMQKPEAKNGQVSFHKMKTELKKMEIIEDTIQFNFETPKRKGFEGNLTSHVMQHEDYVGPAWHDWPLEKQNEFIGIIINGTPDQQKREAEEEKARKDGKSRKKRITDGSADDKKIAEHLMAHYDLSEIAAENCVNAPLQDGTASISLRAAELMFEVMQDGVVDTETGEFILPTQDKAAEYLADKNQEGFVNPMRSRKDDEGKFVPLEQLLYYGEQFQDGRHIIPGDRFKEDRHDDRKYFGGVTNPTVHIALNQIRQVVNALINRYGHPASIAIELGRELPEGAKKRNEIESEQTENQKKNEKIDEILREYGQQTNPENRLRVRLWQELNEEDANSRHCPFSGKKIGIAELFSNNVQIDHLIPFSKSLDDSRANKVICTRQANQDKGQRTPFEAFGDNKHDGYNWGDIFERAKGLPQSKRWRFQEDAMEIWKRDHGDFTERHLNDTRYIGRLTREYLETICHIDNIDVLTGRLTALLRGHWGLNSILKELQAEADYPKDHNQPTEEQETKSEKKNRDDHRHHAIDAIVIGMTNKSILQKVATEANRKETNSPDLFRLFPKGKDGKSPIDPNWEDNGQKIKFRDAVKTATKQITISHKARRKKSSNKARLNESGHDITDGQLHNETALGLIKPIDETKNQYETVVRRPIDYFKESKHVEAIRDKHLRMAFLQSFDEAVAVGKKGIEGVQDLAKEKGIRHLRCFGPKQAIPIKDENGRAYKGYQGDSNWGMEIYAFPEGHKKADKWEGVVISSFDANKPDFEPGRTKKPHPAARLVMRLQTNDCVEIKENGKKQIMRLQKMGQSGQLAFAEIHEANTDKRNSDKEDAFKFLFKTANALKKLKPRKVHINAIGQVSYEKRRKPRSAREKK